MEGSILGYYVKPSAFPIRSLEELVKHSRAFKAAEISPEFFTILVQAIQELP
jgi:hypothetical protein